MLGRGLLVTTAAALLAAGCSAGGSASSTAPTAGAGSTLAPTTTVAAAPNLTPELLSLSDMPTGWSVDTSQTTGTGPDCLKPLKANTGSDAHVSVSFNGSASGIPGITENLAHFPVGGGPAALARFDQAVTSCKTITITSGGQTLSGTIGAMSFPQIGQESHAYQVSLTYKGFTIGLDVVIARHGDTAMSLVYGDLGSPDVAQVQRFATTAIAKVP